MAHKLSLASSLLAIVSVDYNIFESAFLVSSVGLAVCVCVCVPLTGPSWRTCRKHLRFLLRSRFYFSFSRA